MSWFIPDLLTLCQNAMGHETGFAQGSTLAQLFGEILPKSGLWRICVMIVAFRARERFGRAINGMIVVPQSSVLEDPASRGEVCDADLAAFYGGNGLQPIFPGPQGASRARRHRRHAPPWGACRAL